MNVMKQIMDSVYLMGKSKNWNQDATLDISKPWISRSLVEVPQSSRHWYFTVFLGKKGMAQLKMACMVLA